MNLARDQLIKSKKIKMCAVVKESAEISIVMPVKTAPFLLEPCILSLLQQTFPYFELVCICDGPGDFVEIIEKMAQKDNRIKPFFLKKSKGAGYCRNYGIKRSKGRYIQFLDSDDLFEKDMLEKMYEQAERVEADITICAAKSLDMQSQYQSLIPSALRTESIKQPVFSKKSVENIFSTTSSCVWNKLYRTELIRKNKLKFQTISSSNDTAFSILTLLLAEKITYVNEALVVYRINQLLSTTSKRDIFNSLRVCRFIMNELKKRPFLEEYTRLLDLPFQNSLSYELSFPRKLSDKNRLIWKYLPFFSSFDVKEKFLNYLVPPITVIQIVTTYENIREIFNSFFFQAYQNFEWIVISTLPRASIDFWLSDYSIRLDRIILTNPKSLEKRLLKVIETIQGEYVFLNKRDILLKKYAMNYLAYSTTMNSSIVFGKLSCLLDARNLIEKNNIPILFKRELPINYLLSYFKDESNFVNVENMCCLSENIILEPRRTS